MVATPIGHMDDLSPRARVVLNQVDLVCAEDTRHFRHLLQVAQISPGSQKVISVHSHNEAEQSSFVLSALKAGQRVAIVSDAGTPGMADPGQRLTNAAWEHGFSVIPVPGPSAVTAALSICGFSPQEDRPWSFWGFLPARSHARQKRLHAIAQTGGVCLVFESPHRLTESLKDCVSILGGDTPAMLAKELTKRFETVSRGPLAELLRQRAARMHEDASTQKGEYVLVFEIQKNPQTLGTSLIQEGWRAWIEALNQALPKSQAARILAQATGLTRQQAYALLLGGAESESADDPPRRAE